MGASQSQPPSRHNSRHGSDSKQRQKAASVSSPMKPTLPVIVDRSPAPVAAMAPEPSSVPVPAVAVPIPIKKPVSLPNSGENSYIDQSKDVDFIHKLDDLELKEMNEEMDEKEVESKFGIVWVASDDFEEEQRNYQGSHL